MPDVTPFVPLEWYKYDGFEQEGFEEWKRDFVSTVNKFVMDAQLPISWSQPIDEDEMVSIADSLIEDFDPTAQPPMPDEMVEELRMFARNDQTDPSGERMGDTYFFYIKQRVANHDMEVRLGEAREDDPTLHRDPSVQELLSHLIWFVVEAHEEADGDFETYSTWTKALALQILGHVNVKYNILPSEEGR
jgi:hypothetical protein